MSRQRMGLLGLSLVLVLGAAAVLCQADEPKKADAEKPKELSAEEKDEALANLALAYQMADAGRQAGSPEALLGAARLLSKLNGKGIGLVKLEGVKPITGKAKEKPKVGEPIKEEGGKPVDFVAEIQQLKANAHKLNTNPRSADLAKLIDAVPEGARSSQGGPKWMGPFEGGGLEGFTKSFTFVFVGKQPARVVVRGKTSEMHPDAMLTLEIYNPDGVRIGRRGPGKNLEITWTPVATKPFTVVVTAEPTDYSVAIDIFKN